MIFRKTNGDSDRYITYCALAGGHPNSVCWSAYTPFILHNYLFHLMTVVGWNSIDAMLR